MLLVFGGSLGAQHLNRAICALKDRLLAIDNLHVIHGSGSRDFEEVTATLALTDEEAQRWHLFEYIDQMGDILAASDLVVSRAGASSRAEIRTLGRLYAEKPSYWKDLSGRLKYTLGEIPDDKLEFIIDAASLGIRDAAFEELRDLGILRFFERKNGIVRLCFADRIGRNLLTDIGSLPRVYVFLTAALVREYGKKAAYHDLMLTEEGYITGIRRCLPVVIGLGGEGDTPERTAEFVSGTAGLFDEPVRRIMVYFGNVPRSPAHVQAAERFQVETASIEELTKLLEPR